MSSISALNKTLNEEKMKFHDELNPAIWEGTNLKEKVAIKLMEIASNFVAYLDTNGFTIDDIIITGSMANYNYTDQSDIDLHIICDYDKLPTNCPILSQEYFQAKKKIYNDKHNIKIYGYDVELYVEDKSAPSLAGGKYSLLKREWLRFPQKIDFEVDDVIGTEELMDLITQIENVCMTDGNIQEAEELLNHIYEMRKSGLAKGGEFAFENLLFKALRNRGYLDKLRSYIAYAEDLSLSLNESVEKLTSNENVIYINSASQAAQFIKSQKKDFRGLAIDDKSGYYFSPYDETTKYNHFSMILAAYKDGLLGSMIDVPDFSNDFSGNHKKNQYVNDSLSELLDNSYPFIVAFDDIQEEADEDGYTLYYDYGDFRVYDRFEAFKYLPLYKALGDSKAYDMNNNPLNEVKELNESVDNLDIRDEDGSLTLLQNGYIKAECSYTNYGDRIIIDWIESFNEGQGYATKLLEYIKNKYPNVKVISGEFVSSRIANVMKKIFGEPIRGEMPRAKDYDEYLDDESKSSDMEFKLNESYLTEGIAEIAKKQFPKMPEDKLRKFVALDPTYKGGDQLGKYGQWIIRLFYNNIKNAERMADYKEFYEKNNGINPKTGQVIQKPDLLPQTPYEDADKIPNLLKQYDVLKKEIGQPIDSFKTIPDLYAAIQQHTQKGVPQDKTALERYNVFKDCEPKGLKKIYEDNQWIIGIPTTFESSKPFGEFTNWCTTSSNGYYYDRYLNQYGGEYYILLDKTDGALYQFHFESNQFMDETDHQIDMYGFTKDYNNIAKFLYNYKMENSSPEMAKNKLAEKFAEIIKDTQKIQKEILYENYTSDVAFEGDNVIGFFNLKYLSKFVYYNNSRSGMNLETVCSLLTDFYDNFSFDGYSLRDFSYQSGDWKDIAQKYGVNLTWQDLCDVYDGEDSAVEDLENFGELQSLIQDDFYDDCGLLGFLQTCTEYGTQNECEKDILSSLSDNLPMYDNTINLDKDDDVIAKFSISKEDLWKIYYIMNKRSDDIPEYGKEIKIEKSEKPEMKADWFEFWSSKDDDYYGDDEEAFDDWLYCWRVATGKCDVEDFDNGSFVIDEPYYGWSGFDDKYFEEGCESAAKRIAELLGVNEKKAVGESFTKAEEEPKNLNESILDESVYPKNKYVFPYPDWGDLANIIDPDDKYRYWVDGIQAKIKNPYIKDIPVDKIRQDYDGDDDIFDYDYKDFESGINEPIEVVKYKNQYILMDGNHRAAFAKVNGFDTIKAYVYDADKLKNLNESLKIQDEVIDVYGDEYQKEMCLIKDDNIIGAIEYLEYKDKPYIQMIKVVDNERRKGYGKKLIQALQNKYPKQEIHWGYMTNDGSALYKSLPKNIESNPEYSKYEKKLIRLNKKIQGYEDIINNVTGNETGEEQEKIEKTCDSWNKDYRKKRKYEDWLKNNKKDKTYIDTSDFSLDEVVNNLLKNDKTLNEVWSDIDDFWDIREDTTPYNVLEAFKDNDNLWYPLIKPSEYKQALTEFMKYGEIVRYPEDKIYGWLKTIFRNGCYIESITELAGHTQWFPFDDVENAFPETEDLEQDFYVFSDFLEKQGFYEWAVLPDGSPALSDYGLKPLFKVLDEYHKGMSAGEMLVLINRCLDIVHCRGDFPSAFIEGGSESLTQISNEGLIVNKTPLNESIMFNDEVYDDFQEEYRQLTVWVNPSVDWIRSKLDEAGGFRFLHSLDKNKLYVFTVESGFMHQQVFDMLDFDWSKGGRNVVGVFNPDNSISIWEALADDGEASSSLKLAEELDSDLFKQIYPDGYRLDICY